MSANSQENEQFRRTLCKIWAIGYTSSQFDGEKGVRTWFLPESTTVNLRETAVILHQIPEIPYYVGKIEDVIAETARISAEIERVECRMDLHEP